MSKDIRVGDRAKIEARSIPEPNSGCWLWYGARATDGYGRIKKPGGGKYIAHRLSYRAFVGPIPEGQVVCHRCDVRDCVNPDHLFCGTQGDNIRDCFKKGRSAYHKNPELYRARARDMSRVRPPQIGGRNPNAKITEAQAIQAIRDKANGVPVREIAARLGVSGMAIYRLASRKSWAHLTIADEAAS